MFLETEVMQRLIAAAKEASANSYSPYSRFRVGAAILAADGRIFAGCNVENASYGLTNCAERTAMCKAVSEGAQAIIAVAIYTPTAAATAPCGACRQVLNEFGPQAKVLCVCDSEERIETTIAQLLPGAFDSTHLETTGKPHPKS